MLTITYDVHVESEDDPFITVTQKALHKLTVASVPGAYLVDAMPFCSFLFDEV